MLYMSDEQQPASPQQPSNPPTPPAPPAVPPSPATPPMATPPAASPAVGGWYGPPSSLPSPSPVAGGDDWQAQYLKSRRLVRILAITTAAASVLAIVFAIWGFSQMNAAKQQPNAGRFGSMGGYGGPPGGGFGGGGAFVTRFFNSDGSLNTAEVEQFKERASSGNGPGLERFGEALQRAVQEGSITSAQAAELSAALGISSTGSATSPSASPSASTSPASFTITSAGLVSGV